MNLKKKRTVKTAIGLDFGAHSLKYAVGQWANDKLKISAYGTIEYGQELFKNGYILDENMMRDKLTSVLKANKIKIKDAFISVESTEIIKREIIIPKVDEADLKDLIGYEIGQYLPIDLNQYVLQYRITKEIEDDRGKQFMVTVGAMPKSMAEQYHQFVLSCGLSPRKLDIHSHSLSRFIKWNYAKSAELEGKTIALVDFGHHMINVNLYSDDDVVFGRIINLGSSGFDEIIHKYSDAAESDVNKIKQNMKIITEEFNDRYQALDYNRFSDEESDLPPHDIMIMEMRSYIEECLSELNKVLKYYTSRSSENIINAIYLYGGSSQIIGLEKYVGEKLDLPARVLKIENKIEMQSKASGVMSNGYVHVLGLLMN